MYAFTTFTPYFQSKWVISKAVFSSRILSTCLLMLSPRYSQKYVAQYTLFYDQHIKLRTLASFRVTAAFHVLHKRVYTFCTIDLPRGSCACFARNSTIVVGTLLAHQTLISPDYSRKYSLALSLQCALYIAVGVFGHHTVRHFTILPNTLQRE